MYKFIRTIRFTWICRLNRLFFKKIKKKKNFKDIHKYHIKLLNRKTYLKKPSLAWQKIKIRSKESHKLNLLKEICKKRESTAKTKNIPVKRLIKDQEIKYISNQKN